MSIWSVVRCWRERGSSQPDLSGEPFLTGQPPPLGHTVGEYIGSSCSTIVYREGWCVGGRGHLTVGKYLILTVYIHIANCFVRLTRVGVTHC